MKQGLQKTKDNKLNGHVPLREKILAFEDVIAGFPGAKFGNMDECPLKHSFAGDIYVREIFIPRGFFITGKIHLHEHPIFLLLGDVSLVSEHTGICRIKGPCHFISPPGTKRLLYTHSDSVFVTVHQVGKERDIGIIEKALTTDTYEEYEKRVLCSEMHALSNG